MCLGATITREKPPPSLFRCRHAMQVFQYTDDLYKNPLLKQKTKNTLKGKKTKGKPCHPPQNHWKLPSTLTNLTEILPIVNSRRLTSVVNHRAVSLNLLYRVRFSAWLKAILESQQRHVGTHLGAFPCLGGGPVDDEPAAGSPPKKGRERNISVCITTFYLHFLGVAKKDVRFLGGVIIFLNKSDLDVI